MQLLSDRDRTCSAHRDLMQPSTVLFLATNPVTSPPLRLAEECRTIENGIRSAKYRDQIRFRSRWAARPDDLLLALNEDSPAVLHFSGHGAGEPGLCFQSDQDSALNLKAEELAQVLQAAGASVAVVVLNACYSELQAEALTAHIPCVIGVSSAITDEVAITYAASFYRALAFGKSVANAHQQGMAALALRQPRGETRDLSVRAATPPPTHKLLTRPGVDAECIYVVHQPETKTRCLVVIRATLDEFDGQAMARVTEVLRQWSGDLSLEITSINEGSVRLTIATTSDGARCLVHRWREGRATQICDFDVVELAEWPRDPAALAEGAEPTAATTVPEDVGVQDSSLRGDHCNRPMDVVALGSAMTPIPGVAIVWTGEHAAFDTFRIPPGGLVLGRELLRNMTDDRISRQHARVAWRDNRFVVTDLGSRNGTYVGGNPLVDREVTVTAPSVVRTGRTVSMLLDDIRLFEGAVFASRHDAIVGPSTAPLWRAVEHAARAGDNLLILGEPGAGKSRMARAYARARNLPEAVFNPMIQAVPLERAVDAATQTLILEQVRKLRPEDLATLEKLLERSDLRFVTTAETQLEHLGIRREIAAALSIRTIVLPPLRDRPDEMAFLVNDAVRRAEPGLQIHSTLLEVCLLRPWPGNARELIAEVSRTAHTVAAQGKNSIRGEDLDTDNIGNFAELSPMPRATPPQPETPPIFGPEWPNWLREYGRSKATSLSERLDDKAGRVDDGDKSGEQPSTSAGEGSTKT